MKRKLMLCFLLLTAALLLSACCRLIYRNEPVEELSTEPVPTMTEPATEATTAPTTEPTTAPTTEPPTTEPATEPPTQPSGDSYLVRIKNASFYIFTEPSFDGGIVQTLPVGTYTIVKEATDDEGNLWGKLKSGLGWVCLTEIRANKSPVGIAEADKDLLKSGKYTEYGDPTTEYAVPVAVQAVEDLKNVTFSTTVFEDAGMVADETLLTKTTLKKGSYLVVWVEFPGDLTTYEVTFTDSAGTFHRYYVATNGRNGGVGAWEENERKN